MSKELLKLDKDLGADGKLHADLAIEGDSLSAEIKISYPLAKVIEPATKAVDSLLEKLKAAIPGSWDDALIESMKVEYKAELLKLLAE